MLKVYRSVFVVLLIGLLCLSFLSFGCSKGSGGSLHDFTSLPVTADGWTDFLAMIQKSGAYEDCQIVYISTSGDDATGATYSPEDEAVGSDPFKPSETIKPYATLAAAYEVLRDGYPDIMLLKRGDTWDESFPSWRKSGKSIEERMIVGAYGSLSDPRPKVDSITTDYVSNPVSFFILTSIELKMINRETGGDHTLIEDCAVLDGLNTGVVIQTREESPMDYFAFRRNLIAGRYRDNPNTVGHVQGIYTDHISNLLLEENVFDKNGWAVDESIDSGHDLRSHNTYIMARPETKCIMRYNISSRGRSHGFVMGSGGLLYGNLTVQDAIAIQMSKEETWVPDGLSGTIEKNVVLNPRDISSKDERGWGMVIVNANGIVVEDNILGNNRTAGYPVAISVQANVRSTTQMYVKDVTFKENIIHNFDGYDGMFVLVHEYPLISDIKLIGNRIHHDSDDILLLFRSPASELVTESRDNLFYSGKADEWFRDNGEYLDLSAMMSRIGDTTSKEEQTTPTGSYHLMDYLASVGETATLDSFYTHIRAQRRGDWDSKYTAKEIVNFVRSKFGREAIE
jgi:hypothetical protein